jgi:O-antigen/teichoic acid export membrane protein
VNFATQVILLVLNFATAPYIVHHLGPELFGVVALVQTIAGFSGVFNLGIGSALTKYVSQLYWKGDIAQINDLFQTAWATCIIAGFAGMALLVGPVETIGKMFFRGSPEVSGEVIVFAIYVAALGLFFSILRDTIAAIPLAIQQFRIRNAIQFLIGVISSVGSVILLALGYSVRSVLLVNLLSNLVGVVAFVIASKSLIAGLKIWPRINGGALKKLLQFSLPILLSTISAIIVGRLDRFILAYYLPLAAITFYTLPYSLSEKLSLGVANVTSVVFPFTSELHAMDAHGKVRELYLRSTKILSLMTLPITVVLFTLSAEILRFWLGDEYATQGSVSLELLSMAAFLNAIGAVPTVTALGVGRVWLCSAFAFAASVVDLLFSFLLIPNYGINGAALALLISIAVVQPFFVYSVNRTLGLTSVRFIVEALLRPLACAAVQFAVLLELRSSVNGLISLLTVSFLSLGLFGLIALFVAMTHEERLALFGVVPRIASFKRLSS